MLWCVWVWFLCVFFAVSFFIHDQDQCLHFSWSFGRACGANLLDSKVSHRTRFSFSFVQIIRTDKPRNNNCYFMQIELITTNLQSHRWRFSSTHTWICTGKLSVTKVDSVGGEVKCAIPKLLLVHVYNNGLTKCVFLLSVQPFTVHTLTKNYLNQQRSQWNLGQNNMLYKRK